MDGEPQQPSRRRRVLLVEDEVSTQDALATLLELDGWDVSSAYDGREAVNRLRASQPDLIITDYMMPALDGLALIEQVRSTPEWSKIPILLVSATSVPEPARDQADAFLPKPIKLDELRRLIDRLTRLL